MKKTFVLLSLLLVLVLLLVSCGGGADTVGENTAGESSAEAGSKTEAPGRTEATQTTTAAQTDDPSLLTITGVTFPGKTVVYDGTEQVLAVEGDLPAGASVVYTNEKATDAGT